MAALSLEEGKGLKYLVSTHSRTKFAHSRNLNGPISCTYGELSNITLTSFEL